MDNKDVIYFAHPVNTFGTDLEKAAMAYIRKMFPQSTIVNPNEPEHQRAYQEWKRVKGNGMYYYHNVVLPECTSCVALPFIDGLVGAGVASEMEYFVQKDLSVWFLRPKHIDGMIPFESNDDENFRFASLTDKDKQAIKSFDPFLVLSIAETRARTWMSPRLYGIEMRPYTDYSDYCDIVEDNWTTDAIKLAQEKT